MQPPEYRSLGKSRTSNIHAATNTQVGKIRVFEVTVNCFKVPFNDCLLNAKPTAPLDGVSQIKVLAKMTAIEV
jgi:hypothetical protein